MSETSKLDRILELFFRSLKGEALSVKALAQFYHCSTKSISRDINQLKLFLADHRELVGNTELIYSYKDKAYHLQMEDFLLSNELFILVKIIIGSRALSTKELLRLIAKLKKFTSFGDRKKLEHLIHKELYHYHEIKSDCANLIENIWSLTDYIEEKTEITIEYYKMSREQVTRRLRPVAIIFSEYYFYLIAYDVNSKKLFPKYFRIDRITHIICHRKHFELSKDQNFDEGALREKIQFMFPGKSQKIRFEFNGPSTQAILDRLPTAKILEIDGNTSLIEADVYGDGIKMFLLSQGSWVKVVSPPAFVEEMKKEIERMSKLY